MSTALLSKYASIKSGMQRSIILLQYRDHYYTFEYDAKILSKAMGSPLSGPIEGMEFSFELPKLEIAIAKAPKRLVIESVKDEATPEEEYVLPENALPEFNWEELDYTKPDTASIIQDRLYLVAEWVQENVNLKMKVCDLHYYTESFNLEICSIYEMVAATKKLENVSKEGKKTAGGLYSFAEMLSSGFHEQFHFMLEAYIKAELDKRGKLWTDEVVTDANYEFSMMLFERSCIESTWEMTLATCLEYAVDVIEDQNARYDMEIPAWELDDIPISNETLLPTPEDLQKLADMLLTHKSALIGYIRILIIMDGIAVSNVMMIDTRSGSRDFMENIDIDITKCIPLICKKVEQHFEFRRNTKSLTQQKEYKTKTVIVDDQEDIFDLFGSG